jgi:hypothetical protein
MQQTVRLGILDMGWNEWWVWPLWWQEHPSRSYLAGLWVVSLFAPSSFCIIPKMSGKLANGFLKLSGALTLQADPLVTGNDVSAI